MARRAGRARGEEVGASARSDHSRATSARHGPDHPGSDRSGRDPEILFEQIDPSVIGSAELDALERFFDDIVSRVLAR